MATVNAYERYFAAECTANGVERHAALVTLTVASEAGRIVYEASVTFFPHNSEDDFAVSYDAHYSGVLYDGPGRRSKKREQAYIENIRTCVDYYLANSTAQKGHQASQNKRGYGVHCQQLRLQIY